jgi:hypothetical protein
MAIEELYTSHYIIIISTAFSIRITLNKAILIYFFKLDYYPYIIK